MASRKRKAVRNEWSEFEREILRDAAIGRAASRARGEASSPSTGDEVLRRFAERSQIVRARSKPLGNVVFLHGITGSDLAVSRGLGKLESIWVSIVSVVTGRMSKLRLADDGKREADPTLQVRATGINKKFYGRAVLALRAQWNVEPFAYDWRKDIDEASDNLAAFIRQRFAGEPVHLVAHSMGGLVARNMIRRHRQLWQEMKDPGLVRGGRLIMLGTPNYGSYAIVQVLNGADELLARLERFDIPNNLNQILEITNSFLGTYMLLPAYGRMKAAEQGIYERTTWGTTSGISQKHLNRALEFYNKLDVPATVDPQRLCYVAGVNQPTISGVTIVGPGQFQYQFTRDGDGRVPLELGLIDGVPSYFVDEVHGDLAKNEQVLRSLDELLQKGATSQLALTAAQAVAARGTPTARGKDRNYRSNDRAALDLLRDMAARTRQAKSASVLTEDEKQVAADAILNAALSARTPPLAEMMKPPAQALAIRKARSRAARITVRVGAHYGGIEKFAAPLVVVGHYRGVKPVNAIGAIDDRLRGWLSRAVRRGMISGQAGETFFVPTNGRGIKAKGVIVAGMGDYGTFSTGSLRRLMANVAQGAAALDIDTVGSVLVGAGEGNLTIPDALRLLVEGFASGLAELRQEISGALRPSIANLWIVEISPQRFADIDAALHELQSDDFMQDVRLQVVPASRRALNQAKRKFHEESDKTFARPIKRSPDTSRGRKFDEVRLTIECGSTAEEGGRLFKISALTSGALIPTKEIDVSATVAEDASRGLTEALDRKAQDKYGRFLFRYLLPGEFEPLFDNDAAVRLILDSGAAAFPWEMACFTPASSPGSLQRFGTDRCLSRQFKSVMSGAVGLIPPRNEKLRALVIADPAPEEGWQLPGARAEGQHVARLLREANGREFGSTKLDIEVDEHVGHEQCDPLDLFAKLTSGDYDLVHFAGHGDYRKDDPSNSGWVLSGQRFVSARDIARSRQTPWLIFANACFSGALNANASSEPLEEARRAASIAEVFMQLGVRNYLGAGWTVDDAAADSFAATFYGQLLINAKLAEAVQKAREEIFDTTGSTWGAYQLYGDPGDRLLPRAGSPQASAKKKNKKKSGNRKKGARK